MYSVNNETLKNFFNLRTEVNKKTKELETVRKGIKEFLLSRGGKSFITKDYISTLKEFTRKEYTVQACNGYTVKVESKTI